MAKTKGCNPNALFFSEKLKAKLDGVPLYPLTIVEAPMGYGKTTAIREALKSVQCAVLWQTVFDGGSNYFWSDFCDAFSSLSPELADNLRLVGLPTDLPLIRQAVDLIRKIKLPSETVLVIDDYHFVNSPAVDSFFTYLFANIPHKLHIVILSRTAFLKADIAEMKLKGSVNYINIAAHRALYQADNKRQECIDIGAALLLGRIAILGGNGDEFSDVLEGRLLDYARQNPIKSNRMEADMAYAYLVQLIDRPEDMAEWIRIGDKFEKRLFAMSIPFAQILYGKYLLQTGKPELWLGMEGEALALAAALRCRMATIYGSILTSAARMAQGKPREAVAALKTALDMALPDGLYMPFAENRALLGSLLGEHCPATACGEILALAKKQESGKATILLIYSNKSEGKRSP